MATAPRIADPIAHQRFRQIAVEMSLRPDDLWVGGYVAYEWEHARHVFEVYGLLSQGVDVLEFGCNFGASAIVLASLGARVTAIDVNPSYLRLAVANAEAHGVADRIRFLHVEDTRRLPFDAGSFALVNCNSVLEYVPGAIRPVVQREIDRVLRSGGHVSISGTSNRLWPVELHCGLWFVNYLPARLDPLLFPRSRTQRGVAPWTLRYGFGDYANVDRETRGRAYLESRRRMGGSASKLRVMRVLNRLAQGLGLWMGWATPSIAVVLRKR